MKILILGAGVQGTTVAKRASEENKVEKIYIADWDATSINEITKYSNKMQGFKLDASKYENIMNLCEKIDPIDLIINALPLHFAKNVLDVAVDLKTNYQDFAAGEGIKEDWFEGLKSLLTDYDAKFKANNKVAIIGTGSAPGLLCLATRLAVKELDSCDTIYNFVWEGVKAKRLIPFWFSPASALWDMSEPATAWIDSKITRTDAFSLPITRKYDYIDTPITFVEHSHDEPAYYGIHAKELYKGVKNAYFKYAGVGIDFAKPLFALGRLSHEKKMVDGQMISPYELTLRSIPQPPKYPHEIQTIIDEGLVSDSGCMVAEAIGLKNGKETKVEVHVFAPGLLDSFKKAQMTAEAYITGQSGFLYTKLFIDNTVKTKGLISSDMLSDNEIDIYMNNAKKFEITTQIKIS